MADVTNKLIASLAEIRRDLHPGRLVPALSAGVVTGILAVIVTISTGALIFNGSLAIFVPLGLGLFFLGNIITMTVVALVSAHPSIQFNVQDPPMAILATAIAAALSTLPVTVTLEAKYATVVMMVVLTTLFTGLIFVIFGRYQLGSFIRYFPYPVVGGFLAGTGWVMLVGAIRVLTQLDPSWALLQPAFLLRWLPSLIFAFIIREMMRRSRHPLIVPGLFLGFIGFFYLVTLLLGFTPAELSDQGWLLGPFPQGSSWQFPLNAKALPLVQWPAIADNWLMLVPVFMVALMSFLLNISGLELMIKQDLDLNREMTLVGVMNLLGGLFGSAVGYYSLSLSGLNQQLAKGSRLTSLIAAAFLLIVFASGTGILSYVPRLAVGGMLMYLGLSFLIRWVVETWQRFSRFEYAVIWLILIVIAGVGFLEGVGVGLVAAVVLFVVNYSRINVVKHGLTGITYRSRVTRGRDQRAILDQYGEQINILQLQGFIFFGTAHRLIEQIKERLFAPGLPPLLYLVLDFRQVTGLDSTALLGFAKMNQLAQERGIALVLTHLSPTLKAQFEQQGLGEAQEAVHFFLDLDRGVEWCETGILQIHSRETHEKSLGEQLAEILPQAEKAGVLVPYLERQEVEPGFYLIHQGDAPDDIFFVESGQVTAQLERRGREPVRLETMKGGRVVGEIGFYLGTQRTAEVRADEPTTIYRLSQAKLEAMEQTDPTAAATFHRIIAHLLAERAVHLIRAVDALLQ